MKYWTWFLALALPAACANSESEEPREQDGSAILDAGRDTNAGDTGEDVWGGPSNCSGEWCSVEQSRIAEISLSAIWGSSSSDVWIGGHRGFAAHWDGSTWQELRPTRSGEAVRSLWGTGPDDVWAFSGVDVSFHWTRGPDQAGNPASTPRWVKTPLSREAYGSIHAVSGSGPNDIYLTTDLGLELVCEEVEGEPEKVCYLNTLYPAIWHYGGPPSAPASGTGWSIVSDKSCVYGCPDFFGAWSNGTEQWFGSTNGQLFHARGASDNPPNLVLEPVESSAHATFEAMSGLSPNDVWAVGSGGTVRHWQGTRWEPVAVPTGATLNGVWARAPDDVWIAGEGGTLLHFDGAKWTQADLPAAVRQRTLYGVWGASKDDVWVVGERVLLRRSASGGTP